MALYGGDFMGGLTLSGSERFEAWQVLLQEQLHRRAIEALTHLASYHQRRREYEIAGRHLRRQIQLEPWREEAHRGLMRSLALSGQRNAALAQYEACRRLLDQELGLAPTPETLTLYRQIEAGQLQPGRIEAQNPYKGLKAFAAADAADFYGREAFTQRLHRAVQQQPLVVLIGPSGSGKSSLIHAGLLPRLSSDPLLDPGGPTTSAAELRRSLTTGGSTGLTTGGSTEAQPEGIDYRPERAARWVVASFRPGSNPFQRLAEALVPLLEPRPATDRPPFADRVRALAGQLRSGQVALDGLVDGIVAQAQHGPSPGDGAGRRILLLADQFEELFALCPDPSTRQAFLELLLGSIIPDEDQPSTGSHRPLTILLSLRADFVAQALSHRPGADGIQSGGLVLGPMDRGELRRAIEEPARGRGVIFQPGLVERLLDHAGDQPGHLPLLQFTLTRLWEQQTGGQLTHAAYEAMGGLTGALTGYADGVYQGLKPAAQTAARRVFTHLVRPPRGRARRRPG